MTVSSRVALTDIAEQFGLTKVSVRKALRAHPDISSETKKPVTRKAKESVELEKRHLNTLLSMEVGGLLVSVSEKTTDEAPFQDVPDRTSCGCSSIEIGTSLVEKSGLGRS